MPSTTEAPATTQPPATVPPGTAPTTSSTAPPTTAPTTTAPAGAGEPGPGCVNGWITPAPGTALRAKALDILRSGMGVTGELRVVDMRYFTGPEVPWIVAPRPPLVEWWYVKAQLVDDPAFQGRWLIAKRSAAVEGIAAVARFDTTGYRSPDWRGFIGDSDAPRAIEGLPGTWVGIEFDFTTGEDGETPGLPDENLRCLDGT